MPTPKPALDRLAKTAKRSSLQDLVQAQTRRSLLLLDCSGSMSALLRTGQRRIDALRDVAHELRQTHPVPLVIFCGRDHAYLDEVIPEPNGLTPLAHAIHFARVNHANHCVVITDGCPDSEHKALDAARQFGHPIDVFYVGDGNDRGAAFAQQLAAATGGQANVADLAQVKQLTGKIAGLLGDGGVQ